MSQASIPSQPYFSGISYNPAFFTAQSGVSLTYATNNFIQRVGTNPTSVATNTTFSGSINTSSITTTTNSTIGGNLAVNNNLTAGTMSVTGNTSLKNLSTSGTIIMNSGTASNSFTVQGVLVNSNTSNSGDYTSGSVILSGGMGIAKDVFCNGGIYAVGGMSVGTNVPLNTVPYALDVSGVIYTKQNLIVGNYANIAGNLTCANLIVGKALTANYVSASSIITISSPIINLNGSIACNNSSGTYKFFNMNCPINQVFSTS